MNYQQSKQILEEIKKAKRILVNCHRGPDADSVGSALSVYAYLESIGKDVRVVCPDDLPTNLVFLPNSKVVKKIDYKDLDFSKIDLFMALDSGDWKMVTRIQEQTPSGLNLVVIDHHATNSGYGKINLVDQRVSSCAEIIYSVLTDFGANITKEIATCLLTGIIGDTGVFQYPGVTASTLDVAGELMKKGADKDEIIFNIYRSNDFRALKFFGVLLNKMQIDRKHKFVWSALDYNDFEPHRNISNAKDAKSSAASLFMQGVVGTDFGFIALEDEREKLSLSFRSRTGFDVSKLAEALGGGGHKAAAGGKVEGLAFDAAIKKVLETAKKYSRK